MARPIQKAPFLTARWEDLALITYGIDAGFLRRFLPAGCEADLVEGQARCSLVAFDFTQARVRGIAWPGHTRFPEVNLRFYVQRNGVRGVTFLREFVPRRAIALIARAIYNEPYTAIPMTSTKTVAGDRITIEHRLRLRGTPQRITITATGPAVIPESDPAADWIKEHRWGFGQTRRRQPLSYEVVHPTWAIYTNPIADLDFNFAAAYGAEWAFLNDATPVSVILAAGSEVSVWPRQLRDGRPDI